MRRYAILYNSETEKYSAIYTDGEYDSEGNAIFYTEESGLSKDVASGYCAYRNQPID